MESSKLALEKTFSAEPSEETSSNVNSIATVTARLLNWARNAPQGLAKVEFVSPLAQAAVLVNLREALARENIPFHEIELTPDTPAEQHVFRLRSELGSLPSCVVSITGLSRAFPPDVPMAESLGTLNRNRDTLVHFPIRQIWWMQSDLATFFRLNNYDFDRFFLVRLFLSEIPRQTGVPESRFSLPGDQDSELYSFREYEEGDRAFHYYRNRFQHAVEEQLPIAKVMNIALNALKSLRLSEQSEEGREQYSIFLQDMQNAGYDVETYLEDNKEEGVTLLDAENFHEISLQYAQWNLHKESEQYLRRELTIREKLEGSEHPDTVDCLDSLAGACYHQRKYDEAERLLQQAITIRRKLFPPDAADHASSLTNLAVLYRTQERFEEALSASQQALELRQRVLPKNHPDIALSLNNIAGLYWAQGKFDEAEAMYKQAQAIVRHSLSLQHPLYRMVRHNLYKLLIDKTAQEQQKKEPSL